MHILFTLYTLYRRLFEAIDRNILFYQPFWHFGVVGSVQSSCSFLRSSKNVQLNSILHFCKTAHSLSRFTPVVVLNELPQEFSPFFFYSVYLST